MKALRFIVIGVILCGTGIVQAQFSLNLNFGTPPLWGPAGYTSVRYYYLPDVEAYYDVNSSMFVYFSGNAWVHRSELPPRYRNYDLYHGYKVVMPDYHGPTPYSHFKEHKSKYYKGYRGKPQRNIGERPGTGNPASKPDRVTPNDNRGDHNGKGNNGGNSHEWGNGHNGDKGNGHDGNGKKK